MTESPFDDREELQKGDFSYARVQWLLFQIDDNLSRAKDQMQCGGRGELQAREYALRQVIDLLCRVATLWVALTRTVRNNEGQGMFVPDFTLQTASAILKALHRACQEGGVESSLFDALLMATIAARQPEPPY